MKVSRQFLDDFNLICEFYRLQDEDVNKLKENARLNYSDVRKSFFDIALKIRILGSYKTRPAIPGITLDKCVLESKQKEITKKVKK